MKEEMMTDIPTRCDVAAETLSQIARGADFRPRYTSEQALAEAANMLRIAGDRIRRADVHMFEQDNIIYGMEMAIVEARKPWWRKMWEMVR